MTQAEQVETQNMVDETEDELDVVINTMLEKDVRIDTAGVIRGKRPTIWFDGDEEEGFRVYRLARECGFQVMAVRREWHYHYEDDGLGDPMWMVEFILPSSHSYRATPFASPELTCEIGDTPSLA